MPPRWLSVGIVAFWLAMSGWMFWRDLWPDWQPGQPPAFKIDAIDEVQQENRPVVWWDVFQNGKKVLVAKTQVTHQLREDEFTLHAVLTPRPGARAEDGPSGAIRPNHIASEYRVNRAGQVRAMTFKTDGTFRGTLFGLTLSGDFHVTLGGEVRGGQFHSRLHATLPPDKAVDRELAPVPVSHHGTVLQPFHPLNRIEGLRPGQAWRVPVVDPLLDALAATYPLPGLGGERFLRARVRPHAEPKNWGGKARSCLVIDYEGDDMSGQTWVEEEGGLVLRQEATTLLGDRWALERQAGAAGH